MKSLDNFSETSRAFGELMRERIISGRERRLGEGVIFGGVEKNPEASDVGYTWRVTTAPRGLANRIS